MSKYNGTAQNGRIQDTGNLEKNTYLQYAGDAEESPVLLTDYNKLSDEEQAQITAVIRLLLKQSFILERKYDKKLERFIFNREFRTCSKHFEFIRQYLKIAGIELNDNSQAGVIYIRGEEVMADKLSKLTTIYILILKLIYDEQMSSASTSIYIFTSLGDINERLGSFNILRERPSNTEIKRTLGLLKRYQVIDILDVMEELDSDTKIIIYPSISMVLFGEDIRALLASYDEPDITETDDNTKTDNDETDLEVPGESN